MDNAVLKMGGRICWRHYTGIFLLSFATLLLELALTRVLSVANWYHFGFLVIQLRSSVSAPQGWCCHSGHVCASERHSIVRSPYSRLLSA